MLWKLATTMGPSNYIGPRAILGTATFGGQTAFPDALSMMMDFVSNKDHEDIVRTNPMIDSAIMYQNGDTQKLLGKIWTESTMLNETLRESSKQMSMSTKANPFSKDTNLSPSGVRRQLEQSLGDLTMDSVDIFYLHAPDVNNSIEDTLEEVQRMYKEGKFQQFGLSNYSAWETVYIHSYMASRGYIVPTIYQGMYNAISRVVEGRLFPALEKCDMAFYAYNPLAGGMLSGKYAPHASDDEAAEANATVGGRFAGISIWAQRYRQRFQQVEQFEAVEHIRRALQKHDIPMAEASLRWLQYHSKLRNNDGIIVGASTLEHYRANMSALLAGPLPDNLVKDFDKAYALCSQVCPAYSRSHSGASIRKNEQINIK